ncbi:MAG: hypothetical protein AAFY15_05340 [Cyanobacteria bacterium J06648_11]
MLGTLQSATVRLEVDATAAQLRTCLTEPSAMARWLWPLELSDPNASPLQVGSRFTTRVGPLEFGHEVKTLAEGQLTLILWGGLDGWNEWLWGEGWVQLRAEGVSLLPLKLGQSVMLQRLRDIAPQIEVRA